MDEFQKTDPGKPIKTYKIEGWSDKGGHFEVEVADYTEEFKLIYKAPDSYDPRLKILQNYSQMGIDLSHRSAPCK
jgi:hypothetical protein